MEFTYKTKGVCADSVKIDLEDGVVRSVEFDGGCSGNTQGIGKLVAGMKVSDIIERLDGIRCGRKPTSCPDQLAKALSSLESGNNQ
ncbi:MAG: TIGR03905 family TSCPD domain-containing protein [Oscillospiraceae bacterium]|jgi:uncharacterized protein (TIGR03905 family)|nr:TIGR03905 family TSCPD domain-containing protein [Oscillospiraceae bacterium]